MLTFVLPTEKRLVVFLWIFFQISWQPRILERTIPPKILVDAGVSF